MGMFDVIRVRYPLPLEGFEGRTFQTKDLPCCLDLYEIGADGRLYEVVSELEEVSEEQRPYWGKPEWTDYPLRSYFRNYGRWKRTGEHLEPYDYTGGLSLYDFRVPGHARSGLVEFCAWFVEGVLSAPIVVRARGREALEEGR